MSLTWDMRIIVNFWNNADYLWQIKFDQNLERADGYGGNYEQTGGYGGNYEQIVNG